MSASAKAPAPPLPLDLLDEGARRLAGLAAVHTVAATVMYLQARVVQPGMAPVLDDPVTRLIVLVTILYGAGLFALHRYQVVTSRTLLAMGMVFELAVAFAIGMIETGAPFDPSRPLLGVSVVAPWIIFLAAVIPSRPGVRLLLALGAATMWPVAFALNATRFGFEAGSWQPAAAWTVMNYLLAAVAWVLARWTYGVAQETTTARELGSYRLIAPIGEGGMGEVWRATHKLLARPAAIKLVKFDASRQEIFAQRFHREANAIAALSSPHTVYLYDFGTSQEGRLYYVMELLDGISLQTLVSGFGPQPPGRVVAILRQICRSLDEAHRAKIVHRDLKPSNVMICEVAGTCDFVKVLDFGLAKPFGDGVVSQLTAQGTTLGTPEYLAPEIALGNRDVDARADLYALGCVGYFLLTGTLVFEDANPFNVALKHMQTPPDPPSSRVEGIPADLERVILACLEKDPAARPPSAREVARMLGACRVAEWTEDEASAWWTQHLPPGSAFRSFSAPAADTPPVVQKA